MTIRVVVAGAGGRVGQTMLAGLTSEPDIELVGGFGREETPNRRQELLRGSDVLVDFTSAESAPDILAEAIAHGVRPVSGTTGFSADALDDLDATAREKGLGAVWAPNFAIGAALMMHFAAMAARFMPAAEIIELHHDRKADAPSGTAISTARLIREARGEDLPDPPVQRWTIEGARGAVEGGVRLHSLRLPGAIAHQEVVFGAAGQLLTIRHDAIARDSYVPGVGLAVRFVMRPEVRGLVRGLDAIMGLR